MAIVPFWTTTAVWARASIALASLLRGRGVPYFHFLQPNQYDPGSKLLSEEERRSKVSRYSAYGRHVPRGYAALREVAGTMREAGVEFTDLRDLFAADGRTLYADDCCHFTSLGNELLARAIGRTIVERWR